MAATASAVATSDATESPSPHSRRRALDARAVSVTFDPHGAIHVDLGDRMRLFDAVTLEERGVVTYPRGAVLYDDGGDALLVGDDRAYWLGHTSDGSFAPIAIPAARDLRGAEAHLTPNGRTVVFSRVGDVVGGALELVLDLYDVTTRRFRTEKGPAFAVAGGTFEVSGVDDERVTWRYSRGPKRIEQRLANGATSFREASPSGARSRVWSAARNAYVDFGYGKNGVEIVGPGPTRWVEVTKDGVPPDVITCGRSARALVSRDADARIELRALPSWTLVWQEHARPTHIACSADGKRAAWITANGDASIVTVRSE